MDQVFVGVADQIIRGVWWSLAIGGGIGAFIGWHARTFWDR